MGQTILEIGPRWHKSKEGTPTMGGIFFIASILVATLAFAIPATWKTVEDAGDFRLFYVLGMMLLFGAIGFIDDFTKFVKKQNKGLSASQKMVLQLVVATLFLFVMKDHLTTSLALPFTSYRLELGIAYWPLALLFIAFVVNAVNLTDGIDGLAAGVSFVAFVFFAIAAFLLKQFGLSVLSASLCGGMIGFLLYNYYPARIFMGDTGSLFLGGAVVGAAFWLDLPLVIVFVGLIFLWEAISVVLQVISFKTTGKRIFRMAPFHHHLEMCSWKETKIVSVFSFITALLCIFSYFAYIY